MTRDSLEAVRQRGARRQSRTMRIPAGDTAGAAAAAREAVVALRAADELPGRAGLGVQRHPELQPGAAQKALFEWFVRSAGP